MNPNLQTAYELLKKAQETFRSGDKRTARRYAEEALRLAPEWEEPWLVMATLGTPRASVAYLEQALKINPDSERAHKGMVWATRRLAEQKAAEQLKKTPPEIEAQVGPETVAPVKGRLIPVQVPPAGYNREDTTRALLNQRFPVALIILLFLCIALVFVAWSGGVSPAMAILSGNSEPQGIQTPTLAGLLDVEKATYTFTPTNTLTATPTFTSTPTSTNTFTPTETPTSTNTPLPTDTPVPFPTSVPAPVYNVPDVASGSEHWVDVDLTNQMVYAYEGNTMVNSFLVSTGTWEHPTVTGQYRVYLKFRSTPMSGPGYYLPNVPFTMYFYKGYALHGTYWHNNFGTPMSHGCVNLTIPDSEWLYNFSPMGTLVNVHY
jgi:lipoprotein-anchoring transpeptidase ErfK/SrfK